MIATPLDPLIVWIALAALAVLFAQAALAKATDRFSVQQHLAAYGTPEGLLAPASVLLPVLESSAAALLLSPWRVAGALLAALLLAVYALAMAWQRARGRRPDCGCGGEPLPVSWALVLRNGVLIAVAAVAAAPIAPRAMTLGDFFVTAAALLLGTLLYAALHQVLRHRARAHARPLFSPRS
jgi:Methylamine utilisation protein MauE